MIKQQGQDLPSAVQNWAKIYFKIFTDIGQEIAQDCFEPYTLIPCWMSHSRPGSRGMDAKQSLTIPLSWGDQNSERLSEVSVSCKTEFYKEAMLKKCTGIPLSQLTTKPCRYRLRLHKAMQRTHVGQRSVEPAEQSVLIHHLGLGEEIPEGSTVSSKDKLSPDGRLLWTHPLKVLT